MASSKCEKVSEEYDGIGANVPLVIMANHAIELLTIALNTKYSTQNGELVKLPFYAN